MKNVVFVKCQPEADMYCKIIAWMLKTAPLVILVVGTCGNLLTIALLVRKKLRDKPSFTCFLFLAVFDCICLWATIPRILLIQTLGIDLNIASNFVCKAIILLGITSQMISLYIMAMIAVERTICISCSHAFKSIVSRKACIISILSIAVGVTVIQCIIGFGVGQFGRFSPESYNKSFSAPALKNESDLQLNPDHSVVLHTKVDHTNSSLSNIDPCNESQSNFDCSDASQSNMDNNNASQSNIGNNNALQSNTDNNNASQSNMDNNNASQSNINRDVVSEIDMDEIDLNNTKAPMQNCNVISDSFGANIRYVAICLSLISFAIPMCVVVIGNGAIIRMTILNYRRRARLGVSGTSLTAQNATTKACIAITLFYVATAGPYAVLNVYLNNADKDAVVYTKTVQLIEAFLFVWMLTNHAINFVLYIWSGSLFRKECRLMLQEIAQCLRT